MRKKTKKTEYPPFYINRLKKKWPFSLTLAKDLFNYNRENDTVYTSLRDFLICTGIELEENEYEKCRGDYFSFLEKKVEKMGIWHIDKYPGFFIKKNKVYYQESIKSKLKKSKKSELITKIYNLDNIPYQTVIIEGAKFYINSFFQGSIIDMELPDLEELSFGQVWVPVFYYLLFSKYSSSMKKMLEEQNYMKNYKGTILYSLKYIFKQMKSQGVMQSELKELLFKTERDITKERLLNLFDFSGISKDESETLIKNFLLTESLDEIISSYQKL